MSAPEERVAIRLEMAALCLDCDVVYDLRSGECPICTTATFLSLARVLAPRRAGA